MHHRIMFAMALLLPLTPPAMGQMEPARRSSWFIHSVLRGPSPVASLPAHVCAGDGDLSLFADFDDVDGEAIAIYLVNRTDLRIAFAAVEGDPYLKLEGQDDDGHWDRAQGQGNFGGCGNSYHFRALRPGEYFKTTGYYPSDGEPRNIRFRIYQEDAYILDEDADGLRFPRPRVDKKLPIHLVSNSGPGHVRLQDVELARQDAFAPRFGTFATVKSLAIGETGGGPFGSFRNQAVYNLHRFPTKKSFSVLNGLIDTDNPEGATTAIRALAKMGLHYAPAEERYQELLTGTDVTLRMYATQSLTERPVTPAVIAFAKEQLEHDDLLVRLMTMRVIANQCKSDPDIKAYVNSLYDDPNPKIRSMFETMLFPTCINYNEPGRKWPDRIGRC